MPEAKATHERESRFAFPSALAEKIFHEWHNTRSPALKPYFPQPPISALTELVNVCFFASLKQEEGRQLQFQVALCPSSQLGEPPFRFCRFVRTFNPIRFTSTRRFSVHEVMRLALATSPESSLLLVDFDGTKPNELTLWGIVDTGSDSSSGHVALECLRVRVSGPGDIVVTLHGDSLCAYRDGSITVPEGALINSGPIYQFFRETGFDLCRIAPRRDEVNTNNEFHERDTRAIVYLHTLHQVIAGVQRLNHGGCILFVPSDVAKNLPMNLDIKYECGNAAIWECLVGKVKLDDEYFHLWDLAIKQQPCDAQLLDLLQSQRSDAERGLNEAIDTLARLTAVDGAVVLTPRFELLGFGAVVAAGRTQFKVFRCSNREGTDRNQVSVENYGTRHRSAFEFCYASKPSVAFVVSQDGGQKSVTRVGDDVLFWENTSFDSREG